MGLVLVPNGGATYTGPVPRYGAVLTLEEADAVKALNTGLAWLRANAAPGDWFARLDDDDQYGPTYAASIAEVALAGADWTGSPQHVVQLTDGARVRWGFPGVTACVGGTLAGRIDAALDFKPVFPTEDQAWCQDMLAKGLVFRPHQGDFVRIRHPGCHSKMTDAQLRILAQEI